MNPTETLRAAANLLREMAQTATPGPWRDSTINGNRYAALVSDTQPAGRERGGWDDTEGYGGYVVGESLITPDRRLIATLGPDFAVLVADWLDDTATGEDWLDAQLAPGLMPYVPRLPDWTPLALARHVLGEEVPQIAPTQAQERPNPANVGTGEGAGLEGAQIGAQEIKPERPREGE